MIGRGVAIAGAVACLVCPEGRTQAVVRVVAGARLSTPLVRDSIVTPFTVRASVAPVIGLGLKTALKPGWRFDALLEGSSSHVARHDQSGATGDLGRVTTVSVTLGVERRITHPVSAGISVGALKYFASDQIGIFRQGTGTLAALGALTLEYRVWRHGTASLRYDVHQFTTPALDAEGFSSGRAVYRVALALGIEP